MRKTLTVLALAAATLFGGAACSSSPSNPAPDSDSMQTYGDGAKVPVDTAIYGGSFGGSFFGPVEAGKGFVRVTVKAAKPTTDLAPVGDTVVLKMTDTKGTALLPGDTVTFRCRRQYEAVAAVQNHQRFNAAADGTWELDYCRLATPVITVGGSGQ